MDKNKLETLQLIKEMGEKRTKQYIKAYVETKGKPTGSEHFSDSFCDYINHCKKKGKDGTGRMSIMGFKCFLSGMDLAETMRKIDEFNSRDAIEEIERWDEDYEKENIIYKCEACNWEGTNPTVMLLHDENWEHDYLYMCPQCRKQLDVDIEY
jgi:hypothetical protein